MINADISTALNGGQTWTAGWLKVPSQTTASGIAFDLSLSPGNPPPQYYFATPMSATALARSTDYGLDHGPSLTGTSYNKYLHELTIRSISATAVPLTLILMDYLMFYPGISMDTGEQAFTTNITCPRFGGGQIMLIEQNSYVGGGTLTVTYTNQSGVSGKVSPTMTINTQTVPGTVITSAPATAGCTGHFVPLASGDAYATKLDSINFNSADVGLVAAAIVQPIFTTVIYDITAPVRIECFKDFGVLPRIYNDAYLNFLCIPNGSLAATQIGGDITTFWSAT